MNTRLNETSIHMCLEPGEELFNAINCGGKDELFCTLVSGSMVRKRLESIICKDVEHLKKNIFDKVA